MFRWPERALRLGVMWICKKMEFPAGWARVSVKVIVLMVAGQCSGFTLTRAVRGWWPAVPPTALGLVCIP